jgi:uncharacterized protein YcsI (UPF0317 family)
MIIYQNWVFDFLRFTGIKPKNCPDTRMCLGAVSNT